jgi:nucleotide-binding universal stress UspA family protein
MYHLIEFSRRFTVDLEVSPKLRLERLRILDGMRIYALPRPYVVETDQGPVEVADLYFEDGTVSRRVPYGHFRFVAKPGRAGVKYPSGPFPRRCAMLTLKTVLHPTDFSERSHFAFWVACTVARDHGAKLVVLHVVEPAVAMAGEALLLPPDEPALEPFRAELEQYRPRHAKVAVEHRLVQGQPVDEILRAAEESRCEVIVMGTHGRTGLARFVLGSVAERVLREAPCPVLTVKAPPPKTSVPWELTPAMAASAAGAVEETNHKAL